MLTVKNQKGEGVAHIFQSPCTPGANAFWTKLPGGPCFGFYCILNKTFLENLLEWSYYPQFPPSHSPWMFELIKYFYLEVVHFDPVEYLMFSRSLTSMISDVHLKHVQLSPE
jgi:hypothetical protein